MNQPSSGARVGPGSDRNFFRGGSKLNQFQLPGGPVGNYFAVPGTPANSLGIYTSGLAENSHRLQQPTLALQSTAASVVDDWSMAGAGWKIEAQGGGAQYFIANGASAVTP